ncbi:MAG: 5-methylcytosine-specific restriction endonuclease system specificity protein McrC [Buchananella hordeovulneris]|nr:5-methylcytosine-specific restriction endonuclease system specificity protein McrC [Buchananella hordeovulneris]
MIKDKSIFIQNIFHILAYAFQDLNPDREEELAGEQFERIHDLFAAVLAKGLTRLLKQGLHREYLNRTEDLTTLRGKLEWAGTVRNRLARRHRLSCEFDELSVDHLINRVLKTTAMLLLRHGDVSEKHRTELRRPLLFLSEVEEIDPATIRWSNIRFTRNTRSYRLLLAVCQLVLQGMLQTTERGELRLMGYLKPKQMARLFEKFILEYYAAECSLARASSPQIKWALDDEVCTMLPIMQSDIVLSRDNSVLIIDAKYYSRSTQAPWGKHTIHSQNLYQIFAYVKNKEAELAARGVPYRVSGMLLYAKTDHDVQPDATYQMSGNQISVKTLDLGQPFATIRAQLDTIAAEYFG